MRCESCHPSFSHCRPEQMTTAWPLTGSGQLLASPLLAAPRVLFSKVSWSSFCSLLCISFLILILSFFYLFCSFYKVFIHPFFYFELFHRYFFMGIFFYCFSIIDMTHTLKNRKLKEIVKLKNAKKVGGLVFYWATYITASKFHPFIFHSSRHE